MELGKKSVKNLVGFLGDLKTPKFHSEINLPLDEIPRSIFHVSMYHNSRDLTVKGQINF